MISEIISKAALILYGLLSFCVIVLIWKNPSGESNVTNIASLLGAVALVCVAAFPYLKTDEKHEFSSIMLFRDNKTNKLVVGRWDEPYSRSYQYMFSGINGGGVIDQISYPISDTDEVALLEKGVLQQLVMDFGSSDWDSEITDLKTIYGMGSTSKMSVPSGSPRILVTVEELKRIFANNKFIVAENGIIGQGIKIPPSTTISSLNAPGTWAIVFENSDFKLVISLTGYSASTVSGGIWGVFHAKAMSNNYSQKQYTIVTQATTKFGKRQAIMVDSYWKWYQNIVRSVAVYDWKNIDQQIIDYHSREQLWKSDKPNMAGDSTRTF